MDADAVEAAARAAHRLADAGQPEEAIAACEELATRCADDEDSYTREWLANVMALRCSCFGKLGDGEALLAAGAELYAQYAQDNDAYIRDCAVRWTWDAVRFLAGAGRVSDAIAMSELLVDHFEREHDPIALARVGNILVRVGMQLAWGEPLHTRPLTVGALWGQAAGESVKRLLPWRLPPGSPLLSAVHRVAGRVPRRSRSTGWGSRRERLTQTVRIFDVLTARCRGAEREDLQALLARTQMSRGAAVITLGRIREGWRTYDEVFENQDGIAAILRAARARADGTYDRLDVSAAIASRVTPTGTQPDDSTRTASDDVLQQTMNDRSATMRIVARLVKRLL